LGLLKDGKYYVLSVCVYMCLCVCVCVAFVSLRAKRMRHIVIDCSARIYRIYPHLLTNGKIFGEKLLNTI